MSDVFFGPIGVLQRDLFFGLTAEGDPPRSAAEPLSLEAGSAGKSTHMIS